MSTVSLYSIGFNFARIVGPSIGGLLILWIGVGGCLMFYAVCLLLSALELLGIRMASHSTKSSESDLVNEFIDVAHSFSNTAANSSGTMISIWPVR